MKTKNIIIGIIVLLIVGFAGFLVWWQVNVPAQSGDYKSISYMINGQAVKLVDGYAQTDGAPGSASKITTQYFGNEAFADVNGDGLQDVAFLLAQNSGGSGTFYYLAVALKTSAGFQRVISRLIQPVY